jgi:ribonuclease D
MIDTADALTAFTARAARADALALDTEFMREKTYRAELCLLQVADAREAVCIDPIALDIAQLAPVFTSPAVKVMHAARQDLEVLFPVVGLVRPVFDTQIAAALAGHPAQAGYAELTRRLLGVELSRPTPARTGRAGHCRRRSRNTRSTTFAISCPCARSC